MRRLLTFLLIVSGFAAFGQQQQYLGAPNTTVINRGHFRTDSTFQNAIRDTTFTPVRLGIQVYRPADNSLYYSISTTTRPYWAKVGSGAGGSTGGVDSIVRIVDTLFIYTRDTVISVYTPCQDTEGGIVTWTGTGFNFAVSAWPFYCINGVQYSYGGGQVTLDPADPDNPRYDAIVIDTNGTAVVITGTPAAAPAQPQYDHSSQRLRTYIFVPAAATEPYNVSSALIYNENVEWTITTAGTISINADNATNVFTGSKSLRLASWGNNSRVSFTTADPLNHPDYTVLTFWMNLSAEFSTRQNIFVQFYNSTGTMVSDVQQVLFDKKKTGYQAVTIPLSQFQFYSGQISEARFTFTGTNSSPVYLDYIQLQGGIQLPPGSGGGTPYSLSITDGTTTVPVPTGSAIKFQSDNSRATFNVSGNPPTVLLTVNGFSLPVDSIQGLADSLGNRITDVFKANDTLWKVVGGDTLMIDTTELVYYHPGQFRKSGTSPEDALELFATPSAAAPDSVLRLAPDGTLYQHPAPSGGSGSSKWSKNGATLYPASREKILLGDSGTVATVPLHFIIAKDTPTFAIWQPRNFGVDYTTAPYPWAGKMNLWSSGYSSFAGVNADGRPNDVYFFGYNASPGGGRKDTTDAGWQIRLETHYQIASNPVFEFHIGPEVYPRTGPWVRTLSIYSDKVTGNSFTQSITDSHDWYLVGESGPYYSVGKNPSSKGVSMRLFTNTGAAAAFTIGKNSTGTDEETFSITNQGNTTTLAKLGATATPLDNVINISTQKLNLTPGTGSYRRVMVYGNTNNFVSHAKGIFGEALSINTDSTDNSAMLEVRSTTKGFLLSRMTSAQRTAISSPATGLQVFQTDGTEGLYGKFAGGWKRFLTEDDAISGGSGEINTASNVGTGEGGVYKEKVSADLRLRTIKAGTNITVTQNADDITIAASGGGGDTFWETSGTNNIKNTNTGNIGIGRAAEATYKFSVSGEVKSAYVSPSTGLDSSYALMSNHVSTNNPYIEFYRRTSAASNYIVNGSANNIYFSNSISAPTTAANWLNISAKQATFSGNVFVQPASGVAFMQLFGVSDMLIHFSKSGFGNAGVVGFDTNRDFQVRNNANSMASGTQLLKGYFTTGNVAIGATTTDVASAIFSVQSTTKGAINAPRMTTNERNGISRGIRGTYTLGGGTGYTPGTYNNVTLTGGTGAGAVVNLTVNGSGIVTGVAFVNTGYSYTAGDVLTGTGFGAGSGFTITLSSSSFTIVEATEVYDLTDHKKYIWTGSAWEALH